MQPVRYLSRLCFCSLVYLALGPLSSSPLPAWLHLLPCQPPCLQARPFGPTRHAAARTLQIYSWYPLLKPHTVPQHPVRDKLRIVVHKAPLVGLCQPLASHLPPGNPTPRRTDSKCSAAAAQLLHSPWTHPALLGRSSCLEEAVKGSTVSSVWGRTDTS